jgi:hypothetical protein
MRAIPPTLKVSLSFGRSRAHEHADAPNPVKLLRARRERPRSQAAGGLFSYDRGIGPSLIALSGLANIRLAGPITPP